MKNPGCDQIKSGPQIENGYTMIANEFLEALLRYNLGGEQMRCFLYIIRQTWGWHKKEDTISLSQIAQATGITKPHVCRALNGLQNKKLINARSGNGSTKTYRINKYFEEWKSLPKRATLPKQAIIVAYSGNKSLPILGATKEIEKKIITKEKIFSSDSDEVRLAELLFELIRQNNPKARKPNFQFWAKHISLAIQRDGRTIEELEAVIRFAQTDGFWASNILSTQKLREKFDQLFLKMRRPFSTSKVDQRLQDNLKAMREAKELIR